MNIVDLVILVILVAGTLVGFRRGLIVQVAVILGAVAGLIVARIAYRPLRDALLFTQINHRWLATISYLLIFLLVWVVVVRAATGTRRLARLLFFGCADRIGGATVGFALSLVVLELLLYLGQRVPNQELHRLIAHSRLAPTFLHAIPYLSRLFPHVA